MIGQLLKGYEILEEAGRGAAATVYVARQRPVERYVAIKVFDRLAPDVASRLKRLFARLELLDHTNILPVYDSDEADDRLFWVMRYMPAGSLKAKLRAQRLTLEDTDRLITQVAGALDYAQQHGLVHGDLKPSNILLDHAGNAFVADFGLVEALGPTASNYQAPELHRTPVPDARCDVYSLGAIAYELLAGRAPSDSRAREDEGITRRMILPPVPSSINSKLPMAIDAVVMKALAIDPDQRYQTPRDFAEAFSQAGAQPMAAAETPSTAIRRISPRRSTFNVGWIAFGIIGLLIVTGAIAWLSSQTPVAAPHPTATMVPAFAITPTSIPIVQPTPTPTATASPQLSPTATPTSTPTSVPTVTPTTTRTPAPTFIRRTVTVTPTVAIEPLTLLIPRRDDPSTLALSFHTHVTPDDHGPSGTLSMSIPPIEPYVLTRDLAQIGSGEQVLRVSIRINCGRVFDPIITRQVFLTIRDDQGGILLNQTIAYTKRWCD